MGDLSAAERKVDKNPIQARKCLNHQLTCFSLADHSSSFLEFLTRDSFDRMLATWLSDLFSRNEWIECSVPGIPIYSDRTEDVRSLMVTVQCRQSDVFTRFGGPWGQVTPLLMLSL